jgi:hypothetical protein
MYWELTFEELTEKLYTQFRKINRYADRLDGYRDSLATIMSGTHKEHWLKEPFWQAGLYDCTFGIRNCMIRIKEDILEFNQVLYSIEKGYEPEGDYSEEDTVEAGENDGGANTNTDGNNNVGVLERPEDRQETEKEK